MKCFHCHRTAAPGQSLCGAHLASSRATPPPAPTAAEQGQPIAWMRRWAFDGETPSKERNAAGRMAWPAKFKMLPVTLHKVFADDMPLATPVPEQAQPAVEPVKEADVSDAENEAIDFGLVASMLEAYAECIKRYASPHDLGDWHYIPEVEDMVAAIRALRGGTP